MLDRIASNAIPALAVANLRPMAKGTARALIDVELVSVGVVILNCTWHRHDGREWVALPRDGGVDFLPSASAARRQFQADALAAVHAALAPVGEFA